MEVSSINRLQKQLAKVNDKEEVMKSSYEAVMRNIKRYNDQPLSDAVKSTYNSTLKGNFLDITA